MPKIHFTMTAKIEVFAEPIEGFEIKTNEEIANDMLQFLSDEVATQGDVMTYEILVSSLEVEECQET